MQKVREFRTRRSNSAGTRSCVALACLLIGIAESVSAQTSAEVLASIGIDAGLVVHVGADDGELEVELAAHGRFLVQGLTLDRRFIDHARPRIARRGLAGIVTIVHRLDFRHLPYASNSVNLLVSDLDALESNAPSVEEIHRVLAPRGVAYLRRAGKWRAEVEPQDPRTDDWGHFDYDASGNAVSRDRAVGPPRQVQWISGIQAMPLGGNPAAFSGSSGIRVTQGRVFSDWVTGSRRGARDRYGAWDAHNGLPLWSISTLAQRRRYYHVVADENRLYMFSEPDGPLVARDAKSGKILKTYAAVGTLPRENPGLAYLRVARSRLIVVNRDVLHAVDARSGEVLWRFGRSGHPLFFPSIDIAKNRVYVVVSEQSFKDRVQHRWPNARAGEIVCLDFDTGREIWKNSEVRGRQVGQLIPNGPYLGVFAGGGIGAGKNPFYGNIRTDDGKLLWSGSFKPEWNRAGYSLLWRDDIMYYADPWKIFRLDPKTGKESAVFGRSYNARCMRFTATPTLLLHGFLSYVETAPDGTLQGELQSVARSACANGVVPANGLLYFTPNTCRCFTMLRGHLALSPEPWLAPIDDSTRREEAREPQALLPKPNNKAATASALIVEHWTQTEATATTTTKIIDPDSTKDFSRVLVTLPNQHRLECRDTDGKILWQFSADARISSPLIHKRLCYVASRDGHVYAIKIDTGALAWSFLAAPRDRSIVVHAQLESSWPSYSVVLHQGKICTSAGRHPEIGGGIYVWGLEPETGAIAWKRVLRKSPGKVQGTGRNWGTVVPRSCLNGKLKSEGELLSLPGFRDQRFVFDPRHSDAKLAVQLETPPPKKR